MGLFTYIDGEEDGLYRPVADMTNRQVKGRQGLHQYLTTGIEPWVVGKNKTYKKHSGEIISEYPSSGAINLTPITEDPIFMIATAGGITASTKGGSLVANIADEFTSGISSLGRAGIRSIKGFSSEINWAKFNPEIPGNKKLLKEYYDIEKKAKQTGTWMKNPDGSDFAGTPEQFVQQQSINFKKAFGESKMLTEEGSPLILYHGSPSKFEQFDEELFQLGDSGFSGAGIYTTPNKVSATSYSGRNSNTIWKDKAGNVRNFKKEPTVYELYGQGNNPIKSSELITANDDRIPDLFNFHRGNDPIKNLLKYDVAVSDQYRGVENIRDLQYAREIVFPTNRQLKSATGNTGMFDMTNPNIYKSLFTGGVIGKTMYNTQNK